MSTHNICIRREIQKILCGYPLLSVAMKLGKCTCIDIKEIWFGIANGQISSVPVFDRVICP